LSGGYLPLQLWPGFLQRFLLVQPFAGYLDIPLRLYIGTLHPDQAVWAIGLQLLWTAVFVVAGKALMAKQLRTIIVQGG
jgi:ABC-2 type transport system permease protein